MADVTAVKLKLRNPWSCLNHAVSLDGCHATTVAPMTVIAPTVPPSLGARMRTATNRIGAFGWNATEPEFEFEASKPLPPVAVVTAA